MKNQFFDAKTFTHFEFPMQKLMELNVKMMQNLAYIKPMDLLGAKKPEELLEKQLEMFMQNSHMALNYMRDTFSILENHLLNASRNLDSNIKNVIRVVPESVKTASTTPAKKTSVVKKSAAGNKSSVAVKKPVTTAKKPSNQVKKLATATKKSSAPAKKLVTAVKKTVTATKKSTSSVKPSTVKVSAAKSAIPSIKKDSIKKNVKAASPSKSKIAKTTKPVTKGSSFDKSKSTIIHAKEPMNPTSPKVNTMNDKKVPSIGGSETIKDLGIPQNSIKPNPFSR